MKSRLVDPHADAFCRVIAEMLCEQSTRPTQQTGARDSQPPKQKRTARRAVPKRR